MSSITVFLSSISLTLQSPFSSSFAFLGPLENVCIIFLNSVIQLCRTAYFSLAYIILQMKSSMCHVYAPFHSFDIDLLSIYYVSGSILEARQRSIRETKVPALMDITSQRSWTIKPKYVMKH